MKYGLVLEGGAMRGMFTAGVTDVLMENGFEFDGAVGVSAGAAFGCNVKSGQRGRAIRYNTRFCKDKRFCSFASLVKTGDMFGAEFCYHTIPEKLDKFDFEAYNRSKMEFYVVCTDVVTGKAVYKSLPVADNDCLEWIRASASMPLASRIVSVGGRKLLDGGITDSIPLEFMEKQGYERNLVILTQPRGYVKQPTKAIPMMKVALRKYPKLINAAQHRHEMYNEELKFVTNAEKQGRAFVIAPPEGLPVGHVEHDANVLQEVYRIGRKAGTESLARLAEFMGKQFT